ncbi:hypothetical protein GDO81_023960 [Engystomops pustulosus]|uniref:Ig-like domain-containing protein n=1 Tax=Engystomops pustulosus TaxID=76066 RepID=A0AAV6ZHG6_ENGPU|nr:hypothetical protein GDO81_023960 [Engystomops pustulosus]
MYNITMKPCLQRSRGVPGFLFSCSLPFTVALPVSCCCWLSMERLCAVTLIFLSLSGGSGGSAAPLRITARESSKDINLLCTINGFHPELVDVEWMKNQVDNVPTYEPHVDEIPKRESDYTCYVADSSLKEPDLGKLASAPSSEGDRAAA